MGGCVGPERTDFGRGFNSFYFERILFSQFLLWEGVVVILKELIYNSFYFGWVGLS